MWKLYTSHYKLTFQNNIFLIAEMVSKITFESHDQSCSLSLGIGFLANLEGAPISSSVFGWAFLARLRLNSLASDRAEKLPSSDFRASSILAAI